MTQYQSLKQAFERVRAEGNIDLVLPTLLAAELYVVGKQVPTQRDPVFFVQRAPNEQRLCVTAAESPDRLKGIEGIALIRTSGEELLRTMNPGHEIVFVYEEGGDYLTLEQLSWLRNSLPTK